MNSFKNIFLSSYKRTAALAAILIVVLSIPITLILVGQQQDIRQRAAPSTSCAPFKLSCNTKGELCICELDGKTQTCEACVGGVTCSIVNGKADCPAPTSPSAPMPTKSPSPPSPTPPSNGDGPKPSLTVTSQNLSGLTFYRGFGVEIAWIATNASDRTASIYYLKGSQILSPDVISNNRIGSVPATTGRIIWNIPNNIELGDDYRIAVTLHKGQASTIDIARYTNIFSIASTTTTPKPANVSITITNPTAGQILKKGETHTVNWIPTNVSNFPGVLYYQKGSGVKTFINYIGAGLGTAKWTIPSNIASGSDYRIIFDAFEGGSPNNVVASGSSGNFTISDSAPTPTSSSGAVTLDIALSCSGSIEAPVRAQVTSNTKGKDLTVTVNDKDVINQATWGGLQVFGNVNGTYRAILKEGNVVLRETTQTLDCGATTNLAFNLNLPGIGTQQAGANANPKRLSRQVTVKILTQDNNEVKTASGNLAFSNGSYTGTIGVPGLETGTYNIKVRLNNTLFGNSSQSITKEQNNNIPLLTLVSGDLNSDDQINLLDYNLMLNCTNARRSCDDAAKQLADLNDDGVIDALDLNILYRGLAAAQ